MTLRWVLLGTLLFLTPSASLGATIFHSQSGFLGAIGPHIVEDFEDEALVGTAGGGGVASLALSHFTVTSNKPALKILGAPAFGNHNTTPGGSRYLSADTDLGWVAAAVGVSAFPGPIHAVGFRLIDFDVLPPVIQVNGSIYATLPTGDGGSRFWGIVTSAPITSLRIGPLGPDSHWSLDDLVIGRGRVNAPAVPEPSAALLFAFGSAVGPGAPRRRRGAVSVRTSD